MTLPDDCKAKPIMIETWNKTKRWWLLGKIHREDGPACEYIDGVKEWFIDGQLHREDGPAIEYPSGRKEWWYKGTPVPFEYYSKEEYERKINLLAFL